MNFIILMLPTLLLSLFSCVTNERIQTPTAPFGYIEQKVTVENKEDNLFLEGILTLPVGSGPFPVIILISGSGPSNYDEEWHGHKPFLVLADNLTRNGIAVLRLNDRSYDQSSEEFYQNTTEDFTRDIEAAIEFLHNHNETKNSPIGLLGHSEGGIVASMVAAERKDLSLIILLGTPGFPLKQVNMQAAELSYLLADTPEAETQRLIEFQQEYNDIIEDYRNDEMAKVQVEQLYDRYFRGTKHFSRKDRYNLATKVTLPWFRYIFRNDPADYLSKIEIPLLSVIGEFDFQILPEENSQRIKSSLEDKGNEQNRIIILDHMNHFLQPAEDYRNYSAIEETVSLELMQEITEWVYSLSLSELSS